jgi:signal transduction histidine kinase/CheY-like chemotaxis protein
MSRHRSRWRPVSFRARLLGLVASTLTVTVVAFIAVDLWLDLQGLNRRSSTWVGNLATSLTPSLEAALRFEDLAAAETELGSLRNDPDVALARLYRADGAIFASYARQGSEPPDTGPAGRPYTFRDNWLVVRTPVVHAQERLGTLVLVYDLGPLHRRYWTEAGVAILIVILLTAIALAVAASFAARLIRPITDLAEIADRVRRTDDYGLRAELPPGPDEVRRLARDFNAMMSRIETQSGELSAARDTLEQRVAARTAEADNLATQLRALAAELTQAEERERKRLAAALHDDLQQLLVAARMRVEGAMRARPTIDPRHLERSIEMIHEAIAVSRALSAELAPPVLYGTRFDEVMKWVARTTEEQYGLRVKLEMDGVDADLEEPMQVLIFRSVKELLFNVIKHGKVEEATVRVGTEDGRLVVSVEDGGVGFDPAVSDHKSESGGFGLFSIRERLKYLGGDFEVASEPGKTTITLRVPMRVRAEAERTEGRVEAIVADGAARASAERAEHLRVLLVDDHRILRDGIAGILTASDKFRVVGEASSGAEAVELARSLRPDVVVMDISMPGMSGIEATQRITAEAPSIRVVGLSMYDEQDLAETMLRAGAAAYVTKGGPAQTLIDTLLRVAS